MEKNDAAYEFVRGRVIKKEPLKQEELFIANFLIRVFMQTSAFRQGAILATEIDAFVDIFWKRIPDLAYFTDEQLQKARKEER